MPPLISKDIISQVVERTEIVSLVQAYLPLKQAGKNFVGLCPFHQEKTPSFTVNRDKQFFYCFGCGAKGNAIGFLQQYLGIDFMPALKKLAHTAGIELPKTSKESKGSFTFLYKVMGLANEFYQDQLSKNTRAQEYLISRNFNKEDWSKYQLGFAPSKGQLHGYLTAQGIDNKTMVQLGLVKSRYHHLDFFQNRIIFPILNNQHKTIGFGGRILDSSDSSDTNDSSDTSDTDSAGPKYLNTPDTPIYSKRQELYCANLMDGRSAAMVVEGYFDALSLLKNGISNTVAVLGTAISPSHLYLLKSHNKKIIFCYDGDGAGLKAMERTMKILLPTANTSTQIEFVTFAPGEDPDLLIRTKGKKEFENKIDNAKNIAETIAFIAKKETTEDETSNKIISRAKQLTLVKEYIELINDLAFRTAIKEYLERKFSIPFELTSVGEETIRSPKKSHSRTIINCLYHFPNLVLYFENKDYLPLGDQLNSDIALLNEFIELINKYPGITSGEIKDILTEGSSDTLSQVLAIVLEMEDLQLTQKDLILQFEDIINHWIKANRKWKIQNMKTSASDNQDTDLLKKGVSLGKAKNFEVDNGLKKELLASINETK